MRKYTLQATVSKYNYDNYGIFTSMKMLLQGASDIIGTDFQIAKDNMDKYGYSGFVCYVQEQNEVNFNPKESKYPIYRDKENVEATLKK